MDEGFDFREWLKAMGYNKRDAARALGFSVSYVSKLAAHPKAPRHKPITEAVVQRCIDVARHRMDAMVRYAGDRGGAYQHAPQRAFITVSAMGHRAPNPSP
jgi:hypothetical protein